MDPLLLFFWPLNFQEDVWLNQLDIIFPLSLINFLKVQTSVKTTMTSWKFLDFFFEVSWFYDNSQQQTCMKFAVKHQKSSQINNNRNEGRMWIVDLCKSNNHRINSSRSSLIKFSQSLAGSSAAKPTSCSLLRPFFPQLFMFFWESLIKLPRKQNDLVAAAEMALLASSTHNFLINH